MEQQYEDKAYLKPYLINQEYSRGKRFQKFPGKKIINPATKEVEGRKFEGN